MWLNFFQGISSIPLSIICQIVIVTLLIFLIFNFIMVLAFLVTSLLLLLYAAYVLLCLLKLLSLNFLNFIIQKITHCIIEKTHFKNEFYIGCFALFAILIAYSLNFSIVIGYLKLFNFAPNIIHMSSYYQKTAFAQIFHQMPTFTFWEIIRTSISPFNEKFVFNLKYTEHKFETRNCN